MDEPAPQKKSTWERFLDQKTTPQRLLLAVAAIVAAVGLLGALAVTIGDRLGGDDPDGTEVVEVGELNGEVIEQGTASADDFVRHLVSVAGGAPVQLDLTVRAPETESAIGSHLPLWYNCDDGAVVGDGACNLVRLEFPTDTPPAVTNPLGWRFQGRYRVTIRNGVDFGTDLDLSFDDIDS